MYTNNLNAVCIVVGSPISISERAGPVAAMLADAKRMHLQHGPIDLIIEAFGAEGEIKRSYSQAREAFEPVLDGLVSELPLLRKQVGEKPLGPVARAMWEAALPFGSEFVTPMVAVAGSVADHILNAMLAGCELERAYVNNGGDIAIVVRDGTFTIGICDDPVTGRSGGAVTIGADDNIGGIATSGWRGRSFSFGIADAVTVLAETAAKADAAATMIANRVDLPGSTKITREPANSLKPDSDLGARLVTTDVAVLAPADVKSALSTGVITAEEYHERGLIRAAYLALAGERLTVPQENQNHSTSGRLPHG